MYIIRKLANYGEEVISTRSRNLIFQEKEVGAELIRGGTEESPNVKLCQRSCLSAFVFANSVDAMQCDLCRKDYDLKANPEIVKNKQVGKLHSI